MKCIIYTDENNYVTGFALPANEEEEKKAVEISEEVLNSQNLNFYKYEEGKLIFDEKKEAKKEVENKILCLKNQLWWYDSPYGDWKNIKQLDTGEYTEEEMAEYRAKRQEIREKINELEKELEKLKNE